MASSIGASIANTFFQSQSTTTSSAIDTTGANCIVIFVYGVSAVINNASLMSDSKGNTWTLMAGPGRSNGGVADPSVMVFGVLNPTVG
jgi:hypothetical protein